MEDGSNNPDKRREIARDKPDFFDESGEETGVSDEKSTKSGRLPDGYSLLRWVLVNLPYAFASLLVGVYFYYIRDYGQGLSTILAVMTFVLLFLIPFFIGEKASRSPAPVKVPLWILHFAAVTWVQVVLVFLVVLTALIKDKIDPELMPETPISERLEGTPGLPAEEWPLEPDQYFPDGGEVPGPEPERKTGAINDSTDYFRQEDVARTLFLNILDRAEVWISVAGNRTPVRFPLETFLSALMGLATGFLSWIAFRKRPWRILFQETEYEEDDPFRVTVQE